MLSIFITKAQDEIKKERLITFRSDNIVHEHNFKKREQSFMYKLYNQYNWKFLGFAAAMNVSNVDDGRNYKVGYQFGFPIILEFSEKETNSKYYFFWNFDAGLFFNSIGAKDTNINYIMLPAEIGRTLFLLSPNGNCVRLSAGGYGAYKVGGNKTFSNIDAGLRTKLYAEMGSFKLWFGYQRGLIELLPDSKAYNNVFSFGLNLYLGR